MFSCLAIKGVLTWLLPFFVLICLYRLNTLYLYQINQ